MDDPPDSPVELVWPRLIRDASVRIVYLDLNHWIGLAKAATGHPGGDPFRAALRTCRMALAHGEAIFPLSGSHYVEVSKIKSPKQRQDLARLAEELSGFQTLLSLADLRRCELAAAVGRPIEPLPLVGWGVGFAFGRPMIPRVFEGERDITREVSSTKEGAAMVAEAALAFEHHALTGPVDAEDEILLRSHGWDPEAGWRVASERAAAERGLAVNLDNTTDRDWRKARLRNVVAANEMANELLPAIYELVAEHGRSILDPWLAQDGAPAMMDLTRAMPSVEVALEMKTSLHRNAQRSHNWLPNDVLDVDAMALAVPYCDIVVTEKHAHHVLRHAGMDSRMGTVLLRKVEDLDEALAH